jgi:hypothetical protein
MTELILLLCWGVFLQLFEASLSATTSNVEVNYQKEDKKFAEIKMDDDAELQQNRMRMS